MRERLIELLSKHKFASIYPLSEQYSNDTIAKLADYLLENGVIVPPTIYGIKWTAQEMLEQWNETTGALPKGVSWYYELESIIDDVVCLAFGAGMLYREEAENALKEREKDGKQ